MNHCLALLFAVSSFAADDSCARFEKEFSAGYSLVNTGCREHSDCVAGNYDWDPCVVRAVSKEQTFQDYAQGRSALHAACGYVAKPCAGVAEPAYCINGKCALRGEAERRFPVYRFFVPKLKAGKAVLMRDTGIRCATAPCPSAEEVFSATIKDHRFTVPSRLFLGEEGKKDSWFIIEDRMIGVDAGNWTKNIAGVIRLDY